MASVQSAASKNEIDVHTNGEKKETAVSVRSLGKDHQDSRRHYQDEGDPEEGGEKDKKRDGGAAKEKFGHADEPAERTGRKIHRNKDTGQGKNDSGDHQGGKGKDLGRRGIQEAPKA